MAQSKSTTKRQPAKKRLSSSSRTKSTQRKPVKKKAKSKDITLRLTRKVSLQLKVKVVKKPAKKLSAKAKKQRQAKLTRIKQASITLTLLLLGGFGSLYFGYKAFAAPANEPVLASQAVAVSPLPAVKKGLKPSNAVKLEIPSIDLSASVKVVGKNKDGTLEVPADYHEAGQYSKAPTPGEIGPAVIDGHVDSIFGIGVFWRLRELRAGQIIRVHRKDGKVVTFKVYKVVAVSQNDFPTAEVYGNTKDAELRLITCGGTFNFFQRHYNKNIVVFAKSV